MHVPVENPSSLVDGSVIRATLTTLSEGTRYYIRVYVTVADTNVRVLSNTLVATTKASPVLGVLSLDESIASNRGLSSISVAVNLSSRGSEPISQAGFIYSDTESNISSLDTDELDLSALADANLMHAPVEHPSSLVDGSVIRATLTTLSEGTRYYIRVYVTVADTNVRVLSNTLSASTLLQQSPFQLSLDTESAAACLNASQPPVYTCALLSPPTAVSTLAIFSIHGGTACASPTFTATSTINGETPMITDSSNPQLRVAFFGLSPTRTYKSITVTKDCGSRYNRASQAVGFFLYSDADQDGLIEMHSIEQLAHIRANLAGRIEIPNPVNEPANCNDDDSSTAIPLCGYELVRNLDFSEPSSYASGHVNYCLRPLNTEGTRLCTDGDDNTQPNSTHVVDASSGDNAGWEPIGSSGNTSFTGILDGNGYTISNLYVNRGRANNTGLIGHSTGPLCNIWLRNAFVRGNNNVGGLVGVAYDVITASHATGSVRGENDFVGGLVGWSNSTINTSYATGSASGNDNVGGLAGVTNGAITASYATGSVNGFLGVGGLVGVASGAITASYATGHVDGNGNNVGGLVGRATATITASYATGSVRGENDFVGGLAGRATTAINTSYATGSVRGDDNVGGLAGVASGAITASYATGSVRGDEDVGGLVGVAYDVITVSYATGSARGNDNVGGLAGWSNGTITASYATGSVSGSSDTGWLLGSRVGSATISHSCGGLSLSKLQIASTSSTFVYTESDNITCNAAGNNSTPVSDIRLFHKWDHHYYRRTGAGTDTSPHIYTLVTEDASGCSNENMGSACNSDAESNLVYPAQGTHDLSLWGLWLSYYWCS